MIEPGEGNCREAKEARSRVAVATWRGPDEGVAAKTEPGVELPDTVMASLNIERNPFYGDWNYVMNPRIGER